MQGRTAFREVRVHLKVTLFFTFANSITKQLHFKHTSLNLPEVLSPPINKPDNELTEFYTIREFSPDFNFYNSGDSKTPLTLLVQSKKYTQTTKLR